MNIILTISTSTIVGREGFGLDSKLNAKKEIRKYTDFNVYPFE